EGIELVTMDYNVYLKCIHLGVDVELVETETKIENLSMIYKGKKAPIYVSKNIIDKVFADGWTKADGLVDGVEFNPNECTTLIDYSNEKCKVMVKYLDGKFIKIKYSEKSEFWGLKAISEEQKFALGMLNDDDIRIVTLTGEAGAAKTILSFAVGLEKKVNNFGTGKLYIARPPVSLSRKLMLGWKKGTTLDKAIGSLGSYSTNLERLAELKGEKRKIDGSKMLVDLMEQCAISYLNIEDILGMSFSDDDYIIVDEAELLTKDEMKAILTRGGKQVIIGDVSQASENSGVNYDNSGLLHLIEVGKTSNLISHLTLEEVHRSEIVKEINEIW
ncbi:MAG: PhoH family protein, partial [Fusobacteriaceae bacterium]